jgi:ABC-type uncharacterized transport system permease subunit
MGIMDSINSTVIAHPTLCAGIIAVLVIIVVLMYMYYNKIWMFKKSKAVSEKVEKTSTTTDSLIDQINND